MSPKKKAKPEPKVVMYCAECGSTDVRRDAWAEWDVEKQEWVLGAVFDAEHCETCEGETRLEEREAGKPVDLPERLKEPIWTLGQAKAWIAHLVACDLMFHFEDDPALIVWTHGGPMFAEKDVPVLRERVKELYSFDWPKPYDCPIGYSLSLEGHPDFQGDDD